MDRLKDRLAALAEEVGEFTHPPGVAVTVWRARRRRRVVGLVRVGLLSVVVIGLAVPVVLLRWGPGQDELAPRPWPRTTASSPGGQAASGYFGPLTVSSVGHVVAAGAQMTIVGEGCFPGEPGTVSLPRTGIRKSVEIVEDGSFITQVVVPRSIKPGTYDIVLRCHVGRRTLGQAIQHVVIGSVRGHPGTSR